MEYMSFQKTLEMRYGRFHNPEFTQMELYVKYKDYNWMMDLVEEMVEKMALIYTGKPKSKLVKI